MDQIYRSAQYVIIAYGSENMYSGLSGISRPRSPSQMRVHVADLTLTSDAFDDFCDHAFKRCVWLERGWTYQEYELAKRKLCFRNTQAFLECRHGRKEEYRQGFGDIGEEIWTARRSDPLFSRFTSHIDSYSRRKLTFYSDAIAAITGVLRSLYEGKGNVLCGLPEAHFDRALLWFGDPIKRDRLPNSDFPSWSWAYVLGMCGSLEFQDATWRGQAGLRSYEFCGTLVPWYTLDKNGSIRPINNIADDQLRNKWKKYAAIAYEGGCVANSNEELEYFLSPAEAWPDYEAYIQQVVPRSPFFQTDTGTLDDSVRDLHSLMRKDTLLTFAQTVTLTWKLSTFDTNTGISLLAPDGSQIGEVVFILEDQSQYNQLPAQLGDTLEVMGISLAILTAPGEGAGWPPGKFFTVEGQAFPDIPVVNVFVIGRKGKFAYRRHLGWVCLGDWIRLEKKWEYVLLE
jgi:hypothetical protein